MSQRDDEYNSHPIWKQLDMLDGLLGEVLAHEDGRPP